MAPPGPDSFRSLAEACAAAPVGRTTVIEIHDNGPLVEGELDQEECTIECPRHGSRFDLRTGQPKSLPAYVPVETFPVIIEEEKIKLEVE